MKSTLTFTLSNGRAVEISVRAADGARLRLGEVFEMLGHAGQQAGDLGREIELAGHEQAVARSLRALLKAVRPGAGAVPTAALVAKLRPVHPTISARRLEKLLPRVMAVRFNTSVSHDLPGARGRVRGYRGVAWRGRT